MFKSIIGPVVAGALALGMSACSTNSAPTAQAPAAKPAKQRVTVTVGGETLSVKPSKPQPDRRVTYKVTPTRELKMHVFNAHGVGDGPAPALILYFGGGWNSGNPNQFYMQAEYFSRQGITVLIPNYRVWNRDKATPDVAVMDAKSAYRWAVTNADELGIDPTRIAAGGGSAGGHLAATLATVDGFNDPADDASIPTDPAVLVLYNPLIETVGWRNPRVRPFEREISPSQNVSAPQPPTLIMVGDADTLTPAQWSVDYVAKLDAMGVPNQLTIYPGGKHGFFNYGSSKQYFIDTTLEAAAFLDAHL